LSTTHPFCALLCLFFTLFLSLTVSYIVLLFCEYPRGVFTMNSISSLTFDSHAICNPQRPFSSRRFHPSRNLVVCSAKPVAPPPTKLAAADTSAARIGSLSQVSGVLGCQWGDEGKGKLVDVLAQHFEIVARCQVLRKFFSFSPFSSFPLVADRGLSGNSMELVGCCGSVVLGFICLSTSAFV